MTALDDLIAMFPPPPAERRSFEWTAVEQRLGVTALPDDFKQLLEIYGDVRFCNALRLFRPAAEPYLDLADVTIAARQALASTDIGELPADVPDAVSIEPRTLIQWGGSFGGDYCLWDASHPDFRQWPLVFTDVDQLDWGFYRGTVTEYLVEWLTGRFNPIVLWDMRAALLLDDNQAPYCEIYDPTNQNSPVIRIDARR